MIWCPMPHIPGLGIQAFVKGSCNQTQAPTLLRSVVSSDRIDFEWSAHGTQVYKVAAKAALRRSDADSGGVQLQALDVRCSCPDGAKQHLATVVGGKLHVCKITAAALTAVLDPTMGVREVEQAKLREQHQLKQQQLIQRGPWALFCKLLSPAATNLTCRLPRLKRFPLLF